MTISFDKALGLSEHAFQLRAKRAEVLSSNLANADTPNFKARDFDFQAALRSASQNQNTRHELVTTQQQHIDASMGNGLGVGMQYRTPTQPSVDGNTVDEHLEHAAFMENSLEFQTAFTLLNSRFKGLLSAIRGD